MASDSLIERRALKLVDSAKTGFRVVVLNGPRQSGKSTILQQLSAVSDSMLLTLDDRTVLRFARTDPGGFVTGFPAPLLIDEVQRGGDPLILAIKAAVDRSQVPGQFILAGSSRFLTVPTLSESLAGRARIIDLWPLSQGELFGGTDSLLDRLFQESAGIRQIQSEPLGRREIMERVTLGGFPGVQRLAHELRRDWFEDYRRTLVQRDLTEIRRLRQVAEVPRLIRLLAAGTAQEVNVSKLASSIGLAAGTVHEYLSLLEVIYIHFMLPGWSPGLASRAKRRPKLHFVDSGLAAATLGVSVDRLASPIAVEAGQLLESFVVSEFARQRTWSSVRPDLFHFRDREQREVDLIAEAPDGRVVAVEVKAALDVDEHDTRWLRYLRDNLGDRFINGVVLHLGSRAQPLGDRITALPISAIWA